MFICKCYIKYFWENSDYWYMFEIFRLEFFFVNFKCLVSKGRCKFRYEIDKI